MRTLSIFLTIGLAGSLSNASEAAVYNFGQPRNTVQQGSKVPSISPENARLYFAQRLRLSQYHSLKNVDETTLQLLNTEAESQSPLFDQSARDNGVQRALIVVEGMAEGLTPQGLFGSDVEPVFNIAHPPSSQANRELVSILLSQDGDSRTSKEQCTGNTGKDSADRQVYGGFSANDPLGTCLLQLDPLFAEISEQEELNLMNSSASTIMKSVYKQNLPLSKLESVTSAFHVCNVQKAADNHGEGSVQYLQAMNNVLSVLRSMQKTEGLEATIVLVPIMTKSAKRDTYYSVDEPKTPKLKARQEAPLAETFSAPSSEASRDQKTPLAQQALNVSDIPRTTIPSCYNSESNCMSATANCTGHGACMKKFTEKTSDDEEGPECWACACAAIIVGEGQKKKTTYFGGPACQKKDVSVPFFLLAGFTIAMVAALTWGVGLLYSIGEDTLPSVLGAGVPPTTKK